MVFGFCSFAQDSREYTQSRILFLLDESSSMLQPWAGGREKYKAANELIYRLMDSVYAVNRNVQFSLRVLGNQHTVPENDCHDTKNEVPFSKENRTQMQFRLDDMRPLGVTPIAYALKEAAENDLEDAEHIAYSIILVTDGGESCGGDICDVMQKLINKKVLFKPYIISLEDAPELKKEYACMGDYLQATKQSDIPKVVSAIVSAFRPILKISVDDFKELQSVIAKIPTVLKSSTPSIKVETDTVVAPKTKPIAKTEPKPKTKPVVVDTVATIKKTEPAPKVSKIVVDEERKAPIPLKMSPLHFSTLKRMFVADIKSPKGKLVKATLPLIKINDSDIIVPRPVPVKMQALDLRPMETKLHVLKDGWVYRRAVVFC